MGKQKREVVGVDDTERLIRHYYYNVTQTEKILWLIEVEGIKFALAAIIDPSRFSYNYLADSVL